MTLEEIKGAIDNGLIVHWASKEYVVKHSKKSGEYFIKHSGGHCIGLFGKNEVLNGAEKDFYIGEER